MPRLALALFFVFFVSLFVFRSVVQFRRTGSIGLNGISGRVGSLPWIAGVSIALGLFLAPLGLLAALYGWPGGSFLISEVALHLTGAFCAVLGIVGALAAQLSMGDSWRIGVDESESTALVTRGLFAWVRNPIFTFMALSLLGLVLLIPNVLSFAAAALTILGIEVHVRVVEEPYLERTHGDVYRAYASRVGRFVPGVGLRGQRSRNAHSAQTLLFLVSLGALAWTQPAAAVHTRIEAQELIRSD